MPFCWLWFPFLEIWLVLLVRIKFTELLTLTSLMVLLLSYQILITVNIFKFELIIFLSDCPILCLICFLQLFHYLLLLLHFFFLFELIFIHILLFHLSFFTAANDIKWRSDNLLAWLLLFDEIDPTVVSSRVDNAFPLSFIKYQIVACCDVIVPVCI